MTNNNGNIKYAADLSSIKEARERISSVIQRTPVFSSKSLNEMSGKSLLFKCECFQKGGAFKFRGASNAVFSLGNEQAANGVVTHSSGNHAAALSLAAQSRGIPAYIVVPNNAPKCKVRNIERYGGHVSYSKPTAESRMSMATEVSKQTGALYIPSSNDARIISGQGTIALELLEDFPDIDMIIAPISGGGLISGVAIAAKAIKPEIKVVAAEPIGANDAALSKANGTLTTIPEINTIADGLRSFLGDLTWPILRDFVDEVVTVEDNDIIDAMGLCNDILKIVVEPSGAIGLAAVMSDNFKNDLRWEKCQKIAIVISGGNVDLDLDWKSFKTS